MSVSTSFICATLNNFHGTEPPDSWGQVTNLAVFVLFKHTYRLRWSYVPLFIHNGKKNNIQLLSVKGFASFHFLFTYRYVACPHYRIPFWQVGVCSAHHTNTSDTKWWMITNWQKHFVNIDKIVGPQSWKDLGWAERANLQTLRFVYHGWTTNKFV